MTFTGWRLAWLAPDLVELAMHPRFHEALSKTHIADGNLGHVKLLGAIHGATLVLGGWRCSVFGVEALPGLIQWLDDELRSGSPLWPYKIEVWALMDRIRAGPNVVELLAAIARLR